MDDRRLDNFEEGLAGAPDGELEMNTLFARYLPSEPLPPDLIERTQRIVLSEVRRTIRPAVSAQPAASWNERLRRWWRSLTPAQSLAMSGAVAIVALVCVVSLTQFAPQNTAATVIVHEGAALVLRDENNSFRTFFAGDMLKVDQGDHIITAQSSAFLQPFADQRAVLDAGTHVEIMALEDGFGATQVEYLIHRGSLHNVIDDKLEAGDRYVVHSPLLSVSAQGTDFTVRTLEGTDTLVTVTSGVVTVQMGEQVVNVAAGQFLYGRAGDDQIYFCDRRRALRAGQRRDSRFAGHAFSKPGAFSVATMKLDPYSMSIRARCRPISTAKCSSPTTARRPTWTWATTNALSMSISTS
jgi:hypothetical protein